MARTVGYTRPTGNLGKSRVARRNPVSRTTAGWLGAPRAEAFRPADVTDPRRAITRLEQRNRDTQHDNDMYRIGGGPVVVVGRDNRLGKVINKQTGKREYNRGRNLRAPVVAVDRPRIGFVKGPDGKIVSERKAQTLAAARPVNRPFGKPGDAPATAIRGVGGRMGSNPAYGQWKNTSLGYNAALSRQQTLQPTNTVLGEIKPVATNPTEKYPATVSTEYRTGAEQAFVKKPVGNPSAFIHKL